jgi:cytoskeleton protein RodZ
MGGFGEDLRRAREERGVALETIVNATKIASRHLLSVEQERFDQLPGGLFRKSIVRSYARAAGLDEEVWVQRYLAVAEPPPPAQEPVATEETPDQTWIEFARNVGRSRGKDPDREPRNPRWAGVAALLLLVGGLGWFVWNYAHAKVLAGQNTSYAQTVSPLR